MESIDNPADDVVAERPLPSSEGLVALVTAVRWGTTTLGLLWATGLRSSGKVFALGVVLLAYSLWRTFRPIDYEKRGWRSFTSIAVELVITLAVIVASDCWDSPYIFALFTPVIAAGFARGFWHAFRIAITEAITVSLAAWLLGLDTGIRPTTAWGGELLLVAVVTSYGWRLLLRAEEARVLNLSAVWRLNEANALLVGLNRLARDLPVSFDLQETMSNALTRVRELTQPDRSALLLLDPLSPHWNVALSEGMRLPEVLTDDLFPTSIREAARSTHPTLIALNNDSPGFDSASRSGLYMPLWTGDNRLIGLMVVEADAANSFTEIHLDALQNLTEPIALTIDNARWFDRLRARGATQERTRIARDLHDRVGQGIAYVAFELDRLTSRAQGNELEGDLQRLRDDAREMVHELRETLYDLRTDVSGETGLIEIVEQFLNRVSTRSGMHTSFTHDASRRLPFAQEREVWRICQEAIVNAERHADATAVNVRWTLNNLGGVLEIQDDGVGLHTQPNSADGGVVGYGESPTPGRPSYGLTGMRERADAIGAVLDVSNAETGGTLVRLTIGNRQTAMKATQTPERGEHV